MRLSARLCLSLCLPFLLSPALQAREELTRWGGLQAGGVFQRGDSRGAMNGFSGGLGAAAWFNRRWGADLTFMAFNVESRLTGQKGGQQCAMGAALFNVYPELPRWTPYVKAGLGVTRQDEVWSGASEARTRTVLQAGVGTHFQAEENLVYGVELRMVRYASAYHEWPVVFTAGFRF